MMELHQTHWPKKYCNEITYTNKIVILQEICLFCLKKEVNANLLETVSKWLFCAFVFAWSPLLYLDESLIVVNNVSKPLRLFDQT